MISIIICARQSEIDPALRENIGQTIGTTHEIIAIDNSQNSYTIFEAYNKGVSLSQYSFLLFMHDDIWYHTPDWGQKLVRHFDDERTGAIGVAGTPYLPYNPGGWWSSGAGYIYLLQSDKTNPTPALQQFAPGYEPFGEAVALDGVWFCIRKSLFATISFDETTYNGFHFYDVDTTLQVYKAGYRVRCINDILIHHTSMGSLNASWADQLDAFRKKWKQDLPVSCVTMSRSWQCIIEYRVLNVYISEMLRIVGNDKRQRRRIYGKALRSWMSFKPGRWYGKTPLWAGRWLWNYLKALV